MAVIKHNKFRVDVAYETCGPELSCYSLGFDKGSFTPGKGYMSYHKEPKPVCWTRHLNGCPVSWKCQKCRSVTSEAGYRANGGKCLSCGESLVEYGADD